MYFPIDQCFFCQKKCFFIVSLHLIYLNMVASRQPYWKRHCMLWKKPKEDRYLGVRFWECVIFLCMSVHPFFIFFSWLLSSAFPKLCSWSLYRGVSRQIPTGIWKQLSSTFKQYVPSTSGSEWVRTWKLASSKPHGKLTIISWYFEEDAEAPKD